MADKKPSIHKTILILVLVFIPPFWLLFTDEGSRVSDTALLWLLGKDDIKISLTDLDTGFSTDDIRTVYSDIDWQCGGQRTQFGDSICVASIGTFNGLPSQAVSFYFRGDRLNAMQLIYRNAYHERILGHVIGKAGQPANVAQALADGPDADEVLQWDLDKGVLLLKKSLAPEDEPALLWLAQAPND
jgi:hypothetical protein